MLGAARAAELFVLQHATVRVTVPGFKMSHAVIKSALILPM